MNPDVIFIERTVLKLSYVYPEFYISVLKIVHPCYSCLRCFIVTLIVSRRETLILNDRSVYILLNE